MDGNVGDCRNAQGHNTSKRKDRESLSSTKVKGVDNWSTWAYVPHYVILNAR